MDFLRAGEALLRSSQPLLPFLAPSASRLRPAKRIPGTRMSRRQAPSSRTFSSSACLYQNENPANPSNSPSMTQEQMTDLLNRVTSSSKGPPAAPSNPPSTVASRDASRRTPPLSSSTNNPPDSISGAMDELLSSLGPSRSPPTRTPNQQTPSGTGLQRDILSRLNPLGRNSPRNTIKGTDLTYDSLFPSSLGAGFSAPPPPTESTEPLPFKLNSTVGRTVTVHPDRMDLARAFRTLESTLSRNSVKRDSFKQRFHERAGLRRKRLKSEMWRKRFKEAFRGTVQMVQKMKGQGW